VWAVVTIPEREALADALIARLPPPVLKVLDTARDLQQNHIRAWREACAAFDGDWVGVIQEDAILCDDFDRKVRNRLAGADRLGYRAVSLFNARKSSPYLRQVHARWAQIDLGRMWEIPAADGSGKTIKPALPGELCVLIRRDLAAGYPEFARRHRELYASFPGLHDALLGLFLNSRLNGCEIGEITANHIYVAIPNLADHRLDVPSSLGHLDDPIRTSGTWSPAAE
jgi:hypothetical protein